jgi:hypothetical protein
VQEELEHERKIYKELNEMQHEYISEEVKKGNQNKLKKIKKVEVPGYLKQ